MRCAGLVSSRPNCVPWQEFVPPTDLWAILPCADPPEVVCDGSPYLLSLRCVCRLWRWVTSTYSPGQELSMRVADSVDVLDVSTGHPHQDTVTCQSFVMCEGVVSDASAASMNVAVAACVCGGATLIVGQTCHHSTLCRPVTKPTCLPSCSANLLHVTRTFVPYPMNTRVGCCALQRFVPLAYIGVAGQQCSHCALCRWTLIVVRDSIIQVGR